MDIKIINELNNTQLVALTVLIARQVYINKRFERWADGWLLGDDRSTYTAMAMRDSICNYLEFRINESSMDCATKIAYRSADLATWLYVRGNVKFDINRIAEIIDYGIYVNPELDINSMIKKIGEQLKSDSI